MIFMFVHIKLKILSLKFLVVEWSAQSAAKSADGLKRSICANLTAREEGGPHLALINITLYN